MELVERLREAVARIIDPDAWHHALPTDGCGPYWIGRRNDARAKAEAIAKLPDHYLSDLRGSACNRYEVNALGRFAEYSDASLLGQLGMEARGQLDPEYCQFLWAVYARFQRLTEAADLLEEALKALEDLESANDAVSGRTSHKRYHTDLTEELHESLDWLDGARSFARAILTKSRGEKIDPPAALGDTNAA